MENTLLTGRAFVGLSADNSTAELHSTQNSFVNSNGVTLYGAGKLTHIGNLFVRSPSLLQAGRSEITSLEEFRQHLTYSGERNSFFQTPYKVRWHDGSQQEKGADDLSVWQELIGNSEVDPILADPLFLTPDAIQLAKEHLLPPAAFELQRDSPSRQQEAGADLSKIPPLPPELHRVLSGQIYDPKQTSTPNAEDAARDAK